MGFVHDVRRGDPVGHHPGHDSAGAAPAQDLFDDDGHVDGVAAGATDLFREADPQQPQGRGLLLQVQRHLTGGFPVRNPGCDLLLGEGSDRIGQGQPFR